MKPWEAKNHQQLFELLAGDWYGQNPEDNLDLLRKDKSKRAKEISETLKLGKDHTVLEIGSGAGFTSKHIASQVNRLHCCDISESFLSFASKECEGISNIFFHKIEMPPALPFSRNYFDAVYSDAVFIHLNLYDIYWYFSEFEKVVKPGGIVWVNVMDDYSIDKIKLTEMAQYYFKNNCSTENLLCWNSIHAINVTAKHFGFSLMTKHYEVSVNLKYIKGDY